MVAFVTAFASVTSMVGSGGIGGAFAGASALPFFGGFDRRAVVCAARSLTRARYRFCFWAGVSGTTSARRVVRDDLEDDPLARHGAAGDRELDGQGVRPDL